MTVFSGFTNISKVPELRKRLLFTLGMLAVYRVGVFVTIPGVDRNVMAAVVSKQGGGLLGLFNMFSGGALSNLSIFALGIMPYVSASIILQLLAMVWKPLEELRKEGEQGTRKINQYTRYGTVILSGVQAFGMALSLEALNNGDLSDTSRVGDVVTHPGWGFRLMSMLTLTTGTAFIMWVGEQITERGIGNGISLIIFAGIVDGIPERGLPVLRDEQGEHPAPEPRGRRGDHRAHVRDHRLLRARAAPDPHLLRAKDRRATRVRRPDRAPAAAREHVGHHPADLRVLAPHVPEHAGELQDSGDGAASHDAAARRLAVQHLLRPAHHLLLLLLHGCHLPADRRRGQPEEAAGVHPEHPPGQADGRLHRARPQPDHARRRVLRRGGLRRPVDHHRDVPRAVPVGRDVDHDRGRRRARHGQPDRGAPHHP